MMEDRVGAALKELQAFLGDRATAEPVHRMAYSRDWSPRYKDMTDLPDMVVRFDSLVTKTEGSEFHWTLMATNSGPGGTGNKVNVSGYELWQMGENGLIQSSQGHFPGEEYNRQLEFGIHRPN